MILGLLRIDVSFSSLWFSTVDFIPFAHQSSTINLAMSLSSIPNTCSALKTDKRCNPSSSSQDEETFHLASSTRLQSLPQQDTERTHIEPHSHESTTEIAYQRRHLYEFWSHQRQKTPRSIRLQKNYSSNISETAPMLAKSLNHF